MIMKLEYQSWGKTPRAVQEIVSLSSCDDTFPLEAIRGKTVLPRGNGRSYGDCCLNDGGVLLDLAGLNRIIDFNAETGVIRCEAGVLLSDILEIIVPRGWFIPATPGTRLVTVGGAIANDVHGKAHHHDGTFGRHVLRFELLRSDGRRLVCSPNENGEWFSATIGGLGLTGVILWAEIALKPVPGPYIDQVTIKCANLDEFFTVSDDYDEKFEYTVSWLDCTASGNRLGRALYMGGNHADVASTKVVRKSVHGLSFPFEPPVSLVNGLTLRAFNVLYYHKQIRRRVKSRMHYAPFFYPLDTIGNWNRMYGPRGFYQFQCVIPSECGRDAVRELLQTITGSGAGSFLAVMKIFGNIESPGILSFPRAGVTLAVDFPNRGSRTLALLNRLEAIVGAADGRLYPAKDACMSAESFNRYYPQWRNLLPYIDPLFSSSFWRRVTAAVP